jgi:transporter family protein
MPWWIYAVVSALAAAATAILAKLGVVGVSPTLATAIRTVVVLMMAWGIVLARHEQRAVSVLSSRTLTFLVLSGIATGVSWLAYFKALQLAPASKVAPLDKLSLALTVVLSVVVLGERVSLSAALGVVLMIVGALMTLR